jgi:uncharacterized protein (TIGR02271 family)
MEGYESSTNQFLPDAAVVASDRIIGTLVARQDADADVDVLTIALSGSDRQVDVPVSAVDLAASTIDRVVLAMPAAAITGEDMVDTELTDVERAGATENITVPLVEEELTATTRERDLGSVRINKRVETQAAQVTTDVGHEEVTVERVPINQPIDAAPESRFEGDTLVIPVVEEVLVTEKRLMLREEVHIRRHWVTEPVTVEDTVRREVLDIDEGGLQGT